MNLYKITLYDHNCSPICDGTTSFFTDDIVGFEEKWFSKADVSQVMRYKKSKAGEIVTDYYSANSELNIFQEDKETKVIFSHTFHLSQKVFELFNTYGYSRLIYAENAVIQVRGIEFHKKNYVIGQYKLQGVCDCIPLTDTITEHSSAYVLGNPICEVNIEHKPYWDNTSEGRSPKMYTKEDFKDDTIETYCWVTIAEGVSKEAMRKNYTQADDKLFARLMRDIPGEC